MMRRVLLISAALVLVIAVAVISNVMLHDGISISGTQQAKPLIATNLALDLRYQYDPALFTPVAGQNIAEYPLRLDGDNWSFYGKRIRGLSKWLDNDASSQFYDFVSYLNLDVYESWYGLELVGDPYYEDTTIGGHLAVHQQLEYRRTSTSRGWPSYFPKSITHADFPPGDDPQSAMDGDNFTVCSGLDVAYVEGWSLFSDNDLFFFHAVSPQPLTPGQHAAIQALLDSIEFDVLLAPSSDLTGDNPVTTDP